MNILFLVISIVISGVSASYIGKPAPYGQIATTATTFAGLLSSAISINLFQQYGPASWLKGMGVAAPVVAAPVVAAPVVPPQLPAQKGGGESFSYADPLLLGTLALLSLAGFTLAASRV
jgi:hypothetical protein